MDGSGVIDQRKQHGRAAAGGVTNGAADPARAGAMEIVGRSQAMLHLLQRIETVARSDARVFVAGESGTGKELVTRLLHAKSARREHPFVAVNCAAFPDALLEAELFGYERGAFSGAFVRREGRFQAAHKGTLFLDEVAELPLTAQAKLLRVLETGAFEPLGTNQSVQVDVRVISASHTSLKERVSQGLFREDLYYRLKVVQLEVPPLRTRRGDVPLLVEHFLRRFAPNGQIPRISARALASLESYSFPGNVRELEHAILQAVVLANGEEIDLRHLPREVAGSGSSHMRVEGTPRPLSDVMGEFERDYLIHALRLMGGRKAECARTLGISRKSLWQKLRKYAVGDAELNAAMSTPAKALA
ncbi:MAG: sigma-54-dependent Fis family transcriptional regulator [Planctomycetes bacterium]|nr:sigma-54-dependent Fis family transcriptional regulator [Planctomycetota bacterium]